MGPVSRSLTLRESCFEALVGELGKSKLTCVSKKMVGLIWIPDRTVYVREEHRRKNSERLLGDAWTKRRGM